MSVHRGPVSGQRRAIALATTDWVRPGGTPPGRELPLVLRPSHDDVDLAAWAGTHGGRVRSWLHRYGALLFRDFHVAQEDFGEVVRALAGEPLAYVERSSPRTEIGDHIYTATDHPADQPIALHNENSYQREFPATLAFCCAVAAESGGATPVADTRRILARLDPGVVRDFARVGVRYVRNYGEGVGLPWPEVFQTDNRDEVAAYCQERGIDLEWKPDGGLRTSHVRPALAEHPVTGERVWFNHAIFFHVTSLLPEVRDAVLRQFAEEDLPSNTYYGDGRPIEPDVLDHLRDAYRSELVALPWEPGDVMVVDNLLSAHGREPFTGARRVLVGMAGTVRWDDVRVTGETP
ncbi:TauD/TfdA family dioxygenase [Streptoalloteichus hindustanus]|uniref:Taurine dioxygenase, alpha-ketoglutarate-dependent n=1 Tax=Streptoalloteichus hindustanus TaxID=2017 RepID=A4KUB9_STRHI|nr:TauD/TfdA family dioxygenase [Streptoalloteichus hindustanus]ABL74947.1 TlmR3 [Streptoalloteichus hindustanus]SHF86026.1 Taurine dioxygenase, alpha-ketoglutarate-dependent [Streptoalloteichus hindustanus]